MRLTDEFTISTPPQRTYELLLDLRNVASCVPGGEVEPPDENGVYKGRVVVRLGPMKFTYDGSALLIGPPRRKAQVVHGVEDPPMNRLQAIPDVWECPLDDDAHGVVDERLSHFVFDETRQDGLTAPFTTLELELVTHTRACPVVAESRPRGRDSAKLIGQ